MTTGRSAVRRTGGGFAAALLLLALGACAASTSGYRTVAPDGLVDETYKIREQTWSTGDSLVYAMKLEPWQGKAALCGAVALGEAGRLRGELHRRTAPGVAVFWDARFLLSGIDFMAGPYDGALFGLPSRCVLTGYDWEEAFANSRSLRLSGPSVVFP